MADEGEKKKRVYPARTYPPYKRKTDRKVAAARPNSAYASECFPEHVPSRWEQRGFLSQKPHDNTPVYERMEKCLEWLRTKFKLVFCPRADIEDPEDYESLGVTQAVISDFTLDNWIYSIFAGVSELPFLYYPFSIKDYSEKASGENKERFDNAVEGIREYFYAAKREMKKRVENDAYFLNSQFRSHTIWFLEKFFAQDLVAPDQHSDGKIEFEVLMPPPLPAEVQDAVSN